MTLKFTVNCCCRMSHIGKKLNIFLCRFDTIMLLPKQVECFSETHETVAISDKGECFGSRSLKLSNKKVNACEHIPSHGL